MFSYDERMKAVKLYIQYDLSAAKVIRELGYPRNRHTLTNWYKEYKETNNLHLKRPRKEKFSEEQKRTAIQYYLEHGRNVAKTVKKLGYPSQTTLKFWLSEQVEGYSTRKCIQNNSPLVHLTQEQKEQAVRDLCLRKGSAKEIADLCGVSRYSLYNWSWKKYGKGNLPMKPNTPKSPGDADKSTDDLKADNERLKRENAELERRNYYLRMENDALQMAGIILKKDQGVSLMKLTNREKAVVIGALRKNYALKDLLVIFGMAKSSYCYQQMALTVDKYADIRPAVRNTFAESHETYGYRRVHAVLKKEGKIISEKVVRRLMKDEGLCVKVRKRRRYSSYKGEITPAVPNLLKRDFHASQPNTKWLTDITEFDIPAGKVYLSPIIDCFDGMPVVWTIGTSPSAELVNTMLDNAIQKLHENEHPIIHSDRGCHYRWPGWIDRMNSAGLIRSMSKKGCSPDNSACEGFFGRLKNEMYYGHNWKNVTIDQFIEKVDKYIRWYSAERIKLSLGGLSPLQYRKMLMLDV